jgi:putative hemin transport protein
MRASRIEITDPAVSIDLTEADEILQRRSACVLGADADMILETLPRFGAPRFVTGNQAVRVDQLGSALAVVPGGALVILARDAELWPFPANWRLGLAVDEPRGTTSAASLRFFDRTGARVVEVHVNGQGIVGQRVRACIAKWKTPWSLPPRFERRPPVCAERLDAISKMGAPRAWRIPAFDLQQVLESVAQRRFETHLVVGNPGAKYVRRGLLPAARCHGGVISLHASGTTIEMRVSRVAQLWAVQQTAYGRDVTSLEAFDAGGDPAFLLFGARNHAGRQSPTWKAFVNSLSALHLCQPGRVMETTTPVPPGGARDLARGRCQRPRTGEVPHGGGARDLAHWGGGGLAGEVAGHDRGLEVLGWCRRRNR